MDGFDLVCILSMKWGLFVDGTTEVGLPSTKRLVFVDGISYFWPFILYCINL